MWLSSKSQVFKWSWTITKIKSNKVTSFLSNFSSLCQLSDKVHYSLWCQLSWPQGDHKNATSSHVASFFEVSRSRLVSPTCFEYMSMEVLFKIFDDCKTLMSVSPFQAFSHWMESEGIDVRICLLFAHCWCTMAVGKTNHFAKNFRSTTHSTIIAISLCCCKGSARKQT